MASRTVRTALALLLTNSATSHAGRRSTAAASVCGCMTAATFPIAAGGLFIVSAGACSC